MFAVDVGDDRRVGRQLGLVLCVADHEARAGRRDDFEQRLLLGDRLAVGSEEPRRCLAAGL